MTLNTQVNLNQTFTAIGEETSCNIETRAITITVGYTVNQTCTLIA